MATIPVRGLAAKGILRDPSPYQLDLDAFSGGWNMRFHANKAERAPIFRTLYDAFPEAPVFAVGLEPPTGQDTVVVVGESNRIWQYGSGLISEVSPAQVLASHIVISAPGTLYATPPTVTFSAAPAGGVTATGTATVVAGAVTAITMTNTGAGYLTVPTIGFSGGGGSGATAHVSVLDWIPSTDPRATTATFLGDVSYLNRPDATPRYFGPDSTQYEPLPNLESAWTCRSLRAWGDYLIALNVNKPATWVDPHSGATLAGGPLPNLFKWSDLTLNGQVPGSWDFIDPNTSAGENPLEELTSPIVDGLPMRSIFVIYSENDIWGATQVDNNEIFAFARLFSDGGLMAPNCMVEVEGVHYVFGPRDIYRHDGVTKQSIIDKRNKDAVFRTLNVLKSKEVAFTAYIPHLNSVLFCYNSGDPNATFKTADKCNVGAVYDIPGDTWSFIDLPNVTASSLANLDNVLEYATCPAGLTYATVGGTYYDQENTYVKDAIFVSKALSGSLTNSRIAAYDFMNKGRLAFVYEPEMNAPAFLERIGIDLDQEGGDLTTYKLVRRVFPLVNIYDNVPVQVQIGGSMTPTGAPNYAPAVSFDPSTQYKVDVMKGGRYVAMRFTVNSAADFEVAGFDLDVVSSGRR